MGARWTQNLRVAGFIASLSGYCFAACSGNQSPAPPMTQGTPTEASTLWDGASDGNDGATGIQTDTSMDGTGADVLPDAQQGPSADAAQDVYGDDVVESEFHDVAPDTTGGGTTDAPADAGADGSDGDAGPLTTYSLVSSILGVDCATCGNDENNADCFENPSEVCETPLLSPEQVRICFDTLTCVLSSRCIDVPPDATDPFLGLSCYCGDVNSSDCADSPGNGACRATEETGFGTNDAGTITGSFFDTTTGAGRANEINLCLFQGCRPTCFP